MAIETQRYIKKPLYVDAIQVSSDNFYEIAEWCQGEVDIEYDRSETISRKYIKVRVHNPKNPRQTKAFVGDWLLYTERGYKVYTSKAFYASFDPVTAEEAPLSHPELTGDPVVDANLEDAEHTIHHSLQVQTPDTGVAMESEKVVPAATEGRRVLSIQEQREMSAFDVQELVRSGEAVLVQDISNP